MTKITLKEAKENILTLKTKFKTAQGDGTLSADETKELSMEILNLVEEVAEIASDITEGVPAENIGDDKETSADDSVIEEGADHEMEKRINQGQEEKKDDDDEKLELKDKVAKLTTQVSTMQKEAKQEKLAIEYAKHFPINQREAKQKEFAKSMDSLPILEARLKEVKTFFKTPSIIKEAALQDDTFEITEMPGNHSNGGLNFGGKF